MHYFGSINVMQSFQLEIPGWFKSFQLNSSSPSKVLAFSLECMMIEYKLPFEEQYLSDIPKAYKRILLLVVMIVCLTIICILLMFLLKGKCIRK